MSMHRVLLGAALLLSGASAAWADGANPGSPNLGSPNLGRVVSAEEAAAWDISIAPDGGNLPRGSGTPAQGEAVYRATCQTCHGERGAGKPNEPLVGGQGTLVGAGVPMKTVGSFWPYATTLFDYVRRAMPLKAPKSLTDDQVYAVCAYILSLNGIIGENDTMNAETLPAVRMPNRDGFIVFSRSR
jgi:S-disulfanyl-L-cysteine oxidoreductase SoxD